MGEGRVQLCNLGIVVGCQCQNVFLPGGTPSASMGYSSKLDVSRWEPILGVMGTLRLRRRRPSQLKPSNHLQTGSHGDQSGANNGTIDDVKSGHNEKWCSVCLVVLYSTGWRSGQPLAE